DTAGCYVAPGGKFRDYRRWSRRALNEPEPGWLASTEDTDEVDAHHAFGPHLRRRVHRPGGAGASGRHVAHAARLRDAAGARRREPALLRHLRVWRSQAAVRLQLLSDQAR